MGVSITKPKIFICYMKEDRKTAEEIYDFLKDAGADPWLDTKMDIGTLWRKAIKNAIEEADACVICLREGFDEKGFRQEEVRLAIDAMQTRPPGTAYIIPFIIEPFEELPDWIGFVHAGDFSKSKTSLKDFLRAINKHFKSNLHPHRMEMINKVSEILKESGPGPRSDRKRMMLFLYARDYVEYRELRKKCFQKTHTHSEDLFLVNWKLLLESGIMKTIGSGGSDLNPKCGLTPLAISVLNELIKRRDF